MLGTDFTVDRADFEKLCINGGKAPSGGNIQPWQVIIKQKRIMELGLDKKRADSLLGVGHLASALALGAFFENIIITAESLGYLFKTEFLEFDGNYDSLIRITFTGKRLDTREHPLYIEIDRRVTNRKLQDGNLIDDKVIDYLKNVVKDYDNQFGLCTVNSREAKKEVANVLSKADTIRVLNNAFFNELMSEVRWNQKEAKLTKDGVDVDTLELPRLAIKMFKLMKDYPLIRHIIPKQAMENQTKSLLINSSHLCSLYMEYAPDISSMIKAGQVIQRLWLQSTKENIALHPYTILPFFIIRWRYFEGKSFTEKEKYQIEQLNRELHSLFEMSDKVTPVFIFRLSKAKAASTRSLRIPWEEYTEFIN